MYEWWEGDGVAHGYAELYESLHATTNMWITVLLVLNQTTAALSEQGSTVILAHSLRVLMSMPEAHSFLWRCFNQPHSMPAIATDVMGSSAFIAQQGTYQNYLEEDTCILESKSWATVGPFNYTGWTYSQFLYNTQTKLPCLVWLSEPCQLFWQERKRELTKLWLLNKLCWSSILSKE